MNYYEFFLFLEEFALSVVIISILFVSIYIFMFRRYILSVFDPMFLIVVTSALSNSTVFYLYYNGQIRTQYLIEFIITELSFLLGFFLVKPFRLDYTKRASEMNSDKFYNSRLYLSILFYVSSLGHIFLQVLTYLLVGLPILLDSRMTTFSGGSGFGIVGRIIEVSSGIGIFLLFYRLFYLKNGMIGKCYNWIYTCLLLFFMIVSGNKTNLIIMVYYLFLVQISMNAIMGNRAVSISRLIVKYQRILFLVSIPLIFVVMYVQSMNTRGDAESQALIVGFLVRLASFGDVYYMTLPHEIIKLMNNDSAFLQLFKDFLGIFRIVSWDKLPLDCGIEIYNYHSNNDTVSGPNARYNYFGMLYFGIAGQIVYCFIIGLISSLLRNYLYRVFPKEILWYILYSLLNITLLYLSQDQSFTIARLLNITLFFPLFLFIALFLYSFLKLDCRKNVLKVDYNDQLT